jgi:hypothetical protein
MTHTLHFFSLPTAYLRSVPPEPRAARAFIQTQGDKAGELLFPAGTSTLFFVALEGLTGQDLAGLLSAPVGETEPSDDEVFGGLDREAAEQAIAAIDQFLAETPESSVGLADAAASYDLTVPQLILWMKELRGILMRVLETGGEVATVYS